MSKVEQKNRVKWIKSFGGSTATRLICNRNGQIQLIGNIKPSSHCHCGSGYFLKNQDLRCVYTARFDKSGQSISIDDFSDLRFWSCNDALEISEGDIIATGWTSHYKQENEFLVDDSYENYDTYTRPFLIRFNQQRDIIWKKNIDIDQIAPVSHKKLQGWRLCKSELNNCYLATRQDIIKFDCTGKEIWRKKPFSFEHIYDISSDDCGGLYIAASCYKRENSPVDVRSFSILRIDKEGILTWEKHFGGEGYSEQVSDISTSDNGDILITGSTIDKDGKFGNQPIENRSAFLMSVSGYGKLNWLKKYSYRDITDGISVKQHKDKIVLLLDSYSESKTASWFGLKKSIDNPGTNIVLFVTDKSGNVIGSEEFGGSSFDNAKDLVVDHNGNIFIAGDSTSTDGTFGNLHSCARFSFVFKVNI